MNFPKRIGIVGGGQLGRMLALAAKKLDIYVIVMDPTPQSPAGLVADEQIVAGYKDENGINQLAEKADVVTVELEFTNAEALKKLEQQGKPIHPSPHTIEIIKDKLSQKKFLQKANIPVADFVEVSSRADILQAGEQFGYPFLLKARFDAYDGKGNVKIDEESAIESGMKKLEGRKLYVEKFVQFTKEISVIAARSTTGEIVTYPVVETVHKNNILHIVKAPAQIIDTAQQNARNLAEKVLRELKGAGVFGIEMFLSQDDQVLINEIAPRVHNSGHYTIEACTTSQFEQHIRAITGMELGKTDMIVGAAVMINILGARHGEAQVEGLEKAMELPDVTVHIYGKKETKIERKMGHVTAVGNDLEETLERAKKARSFISI